MIVVAGLAIGLTLAYRDEDLPVPDVGPTSTAVAVSVPVLSPAEIRKLGLGVLPPVSMPLDNPLTDAKAELGELLFFDPRMSGNSFAGATAGICPWATPTRCTCVTPRRLLTRPTSKSSFGRGSP